MLSRPSVTDELLAQIRQTIEANPTWGRTRISKRLCELWDWRTPGGITKDISCRDMLRAIDKAGLIRLPELKRAPQLNIRRAIPLFEHEVAAIVGKLTDLRPLAVSVVDGGGELAEFKSLLAQYHYLGFDRTVGENMKYIVRGNDGEALACLLFGSAAWSCRDRDAFIGWSHRQRAARLMMMTNNTRFLVLPRVHVPHLASHVLSLISRRISGDWQEKYGHGLQVLETFVETRRFRGVCYQAANWIRVGRTTGRGRDDREKEYALPEKDIYLLPLTRRWRENLTAELIGGGPLGGTQRHFERRGARSLGECAVRM